MIEESFKKDLFGVSENIWTFCIITPENPMTFELPSASNKELCERFEKFLKDGHLIYKKLNGHYGNSEHSYFIANIKLDLAKRLAGEFSQQSFIFGKKDSQTKKMTYSFFAISKSYKPKKSYQYFDHNGKLYKFPVIDKSGYVQQDEKQEINYVPDEIDFFSRNHEFKFRIPFDELKLTIDGIAKVYKDLSDRHRVLGTLKLDYERCLEDESSRNDWLSRRKYLQVLKKKNSTNCMKVSIILKVYYKQL